MNKMDSFVINLAEMTVLTPARVWDWAMANGDIQNIVTRASQYFLFIRQKFGNFITENIQFELGKLTLST